MKRTAALLIDVSLIASAATAPVVIEHLRGLVHAGTDLGAFFIPNLVWWWQKPRWLGGWNPWVFGGYPANADPEIGQLHPFGILYLLVRPLSAAALEAVLDPAVAGVGMLLYLRRIDCRRAASLAGALSIALGGFVAAHAPHVSLLRVAMVVPWALWAVESFEDQHFVVAFGLTTAALLIAGHPQVSAYGLVLVVAYAVCFGRAGARSRAGSLAAAFALGFLVASAALLPSLQLILLSTRLVGSAGSFDPWRLEPRNLIDLFVPFAHGGSIGFLYGQLPAGDWGIAETTAYPGVLVLLAILAGGPGLVRDARGRFWIVVVAVAMLLGTGFGNDLVSWAGIRCPARLLMWWDFGAAAIAAIVLTRALEPAAPAAPSRARWVAAIVVATAVLTVAVVSEPSRRAAIGSAIVLAITVLALILAARRRGPLAGWILVTVLALDLVSFAASLPVGVSPEEYRELQHRLDPLRRAVQSGASRDDAPPRAMVTPLVRGTNWAQLERLAILQGYHSLVPRRFAVLFAADPSAPDSWLGEVGDVKDSRLALSNNRVLDLLRCAVVGVVRSDSSPDPTGALLRRMASMREGRWKPLPLAPSDDFRLFANQQVLPAAWLVNIVRVLDRDEMLRSIRGQTRPPFEPTREALVERPIPGLDSSPARDRASGPPGSVATLRYEDDEIQFRATAETDALLVTSELDYPGWTVTVDGNQAELLTVNFAFRGVRVSPGTHEIAFVYAPRIARIGLGLTALGLVLLLSLTVRNMRHARP